MKKRFFLPEKLKNALKDRSGYALTLVIFILVFVSLISAAVLSLLSNEATLGGAKELKTDAAYMAQAGLDHVGSILDNSYYAPISNKTVTVPSTGEKALSYTINRTSTRVFTSTGKAAKGDKYEEVTITATIDENGDVVIK